MAGAAPGLQIRVPGRKTFRGVFDSHAFPPTSSDLSEQLKLLLIFAFLYQAGFLAWESNSIRLWPDIWDGGDYLNIIDILILGFLILGALQGYRKGLISGLVNVLGSLIGFYIAVKEYLNVLEWLDLQTPLRQWLEPIVYRFLLPSVESQAQITQQQTLDRILSMIPQELRGLIGSGTVPDLQSYTQNVVNTIAQNMTTVLTDNLMRIFAFFATYLVVIVILQVITSIVLGPLGFFSGTINHWGGFFFGAVGSLVGISILIGLIAPILPVFGQSEPLILLQQALIYPYLVQIFEGLQSIFRLELTQGLNLPLDLTKGIGIPK